MEDIKLKTSVTEWLRDIYGLEDGESVSSDDIEELVFSAVTHFTKYE